MAAKIFVSFEGDTIDQLRDQMVAFLLAPPPSTWSERQAAGLVEAPSDPEDIADAEIPDAEWDAKHQPKADKARKARAARAASSPPPPPPPEPETEPTPVLTPVVEPPPLDTLKAMITIGVKTAQKNGGGSSKVLELLPQLRAETGLDFIANATEVHRAALWRFVQATGLTA